MVRKRVVVPRSDKVGWLWSNCYRFEGDERKFSYKSSKRKENAMFLLRRLVVIVAAGTILSACAMTYDAGENPRAAASSPGAVRALESWGIRVFPRTVISIINGTAGPVEVEGVGLPSQYLKPGERREITFAGATSGGDEVSYFAYGVDGAGVRTGAVEVITIYLARRGERNEVWVIRRLRLPRK